MAQTNDNPYHSDAGEVVTWKAYVDAIFVEHRIQIEAALEAHDNRMFSDKESVSNRLAALYESMTRLMEAGDEALRQHIGSQSTQIAAELTSVDKRLIALHEEMVLRDTAIRDLLSTETKAYDVRVREAFAASEKAIEKAEASSEKRFDAVNAFREQLAEQANQFLPREVADTQFSELRKLIQRNTERLDLDQGSNQATTRSEDRNQPWVIWVAGAMLTVIIVAANIIAALA